MVLSERDQTRWLLTGGVIGPLLFVVVFLVEGWTRADYDPVRQFVSLLSLGDEGWQQIGSFLVSGALFVCGAVGLRRVMRLGPGSQWSPMLIGLAGVGLMLAGVFVTDPAQGYPPGAPAGIPTESSWHGAIHGFSSLLVFFGLPVASFVLARRFRSEGGSWATYCRLTGIGTLAFFFAAFALENVTGLVQRLDIVIAFGWVALLAWRFRGEVT